MNVLVGANNSGKSTILDAFRILSGAYRYACRYKPQFYEIPGIGLSYVHNIPESSIPIAINNIHTNYNDEQTVLTYRFSNGNKIHIRFEVDKPILMYYETQGLAIKTTSIFKKHFPLKLSVIPTLGPLEHEETIHDEDYVLRWWQSHRAPRMFRNIWYYDVEDFDKFKQLVESTWSGMSISLPEHQGYSSLSMFCSENRLDREIFWSGYGFQIWLQLLTHIVKASDSDIIVVDEPEIYLHPDLQRKIVNILRNTSSKVLIATHSVEIINEVDPDEVLLIDKHKKSAKRLSTLIDLQYVANILGSSHNIHLTRLARGKKVLFVEGHDAKIISKMWKIAGFDIIDTSELTIIPVGGCSQWERVLHAEWTFSGVLSC